MACRFRKNSVRLGVAAIVVAVTGGVVLPATTAMAAPTTEVTTVASEGTRLPLRRSSSITGRPRPHRTLTTALRGDLGDGDHFGGV
ncbi:hypothetical protein EDD94_5584 [Streptomyces sp. PanSC9]|nr:hypothetical protein EDD94_5584 [Streptomyces sp. PanSC9]